jgi:hypothetical protein
VHFDHTSLLATIARRFLPNNPPVMGTRYATAEDLSRTFAPAPRTVTGRLRPFLPYRIHWPDGGGTLGPATTVVAGGGLALGPDPAAGVPDPSDPQSFSLEDLPGGTYRIRTRMDGLYLTAAPDGRVLLDVGRPAASAAGKAQVWALQQEVPIADAPYALVCPAFPGLFLRPGTDPANPFQVGLGPATGPGPTGRPAWRITSPLLPAFGTTKL